jgi:hypothetical protein
MAAGREGIVGGGADEVVCCVDGVEGDDEEDNGDDATEATVGVALLRSQGFGGETMLLNLKKKIRYFHDLWPVT